MSPPIWLLDIDGVVNANKPGWGGPPHRISCAGLVIRWAPAMLRRIRMIHHDCAAQIRWASTWCGFPDQLTRLQLELQLDFPSAFGDRPVSKTWGDLKVEAALAVLAAGRRLVWTDDDEVAAARTLFPVLAQAEADGRALLIAPRSNRGLQPAHLDLIEAFVGSTVDSAVDR